VAILVSNTREVAELVHPYGGMVMSLLHILYLTCTFARLHFYSYKNLMFSCLSKALRVDASVAPSDQTNIRGLMT
jgi:hypothetical protein